MGKTIYKVIRAIDLQEFEDKVSAALDEGYMLQGGVVTSSAYYLQAVTKNVTLPSYKAKKSTTAVDIDN